MRKVSEGKVLGLFGTLFYIFSGQKFAIYEEKTILASIINRFKVTAVETMENVKISTDIILRPANGVLVKLEKRPI